ncbi:flippase [Candidatus Pacearchaeota archaeon]|nr:flippase [Candidatus Pacearchaeota archaeon]
MSQKDNSEKVDKGLRLLVKTSFVVFVGIFISKLFAYVYRIIIARYYGPEIYGLFSLAVMIVSWIVAISLFGLTNGLLRFIPLYRGKKQFNKIKHLIKFSAITLLFLSIFSAAMLFLFSEFISINLFHDSDLIIFLKIFSFLIPFVIFSSLYLEILRAFEEISWYSFIFNILQNVSRIIFLLLFILLGIQTNGIIFSYFLSFFAMFLVSYFVCKYKFSKFFEKSNLNKKAKSEINKKFVSYSWPIMFSSVLGSIFFWLDSFLIGYFLGATEVGIYNAAVPIVLLLGFAPEIFMQLFFPLITKEFSKKNLSTINELSKQVGKWIFLINLPLFFIMLIFPGVIIKILFGESYLLAENSLRILSIGYFISRSLVISNQLILITGKSRLFLVNIILSLGINFLLNILLIPKYGISGAAMSTTIVLVASAIVFVWQAKHYTSIIPLKRKMIRIFFVSIIPLLLLFSIKKIVPINYVSFFLLGFFFILSYLILIFMTGCLDKNDFMILKSLRKRVSEKNNYEKNKDHPPSGY